MSLNGPSLTGLRRVLAEDRNYARIQVEAARAFAARSEDYQISAPAGMRSVLLAEMADGLRALAKETARESAKETAGAAAGGAPVVLAVTATGREAEDLTEALRAFLPADAVAEFPSWETLPHERLSPRSDTVGRRLSVLRRLAHPETATSGALRVVVAPVRAVVQPIVAGLGELVPVTLKVGQEAPFSSVVKSLADAAYARVDMVTRRGEFAVRGGMLDVFPPTEDHPIRVEFFGDEVDQMRWFAVADQRSLTAPGLQHPTELHAPPCREILITPSVMSRAATLKPQLPAAADMLEKIAGGIAVEGMESLAPVLVDAMVPFLDQLPAGSIAVVIEPEKVRTRAHDLAATNEEFLEAAWSTASDGGTAPLDLTSQASEALHSASFRSLTETRSAALAHGVSWWSITSLATDEELLPDVDVINLHARDPRGYQGDVAEMMEFIGSRVRDQWRIVVVTEGPGPAQRLAELFHESDIPCA
ncbi:MAG: transcription-repair coupling factor, partial [Arthrobacter sp.]|nr:transcription-repair coupling factor [Arthrobacter sp.]